MDLLSQLFGWQFMLFCLGIASITFVVRSTVEHLLSNAKEIKVWKELILPIFPVVVGAIFSLLATSYPYPEGFDSASGRTMFGLVAGLLSGLLYRVIKSLLASKITITTDSLQDMGIVGNSEDDSTSK
jgi:xanthosine utilization system XapX-like protein